MYTYKYIGQFDDDVHVFMTTVSDENVLNK